MSNEDPIHIGMKASAVRTLIDEHIAKFGDSPILLEYAVVKPWQKLVVRTEVLDARVVLYHGQMCLMLCE